MEINDFFSSGMVLQRGIVNRIYGRDIAETIVHLYIGNCSYTTQTNIHGCWEFLLPPQQNGGPFEMLILGTECIKLKKIYFGDVFLLSGQSNMEMPLSRVYDLYKADLEEDIHNSINIKASNLIIHQFTMDKQYNFSSNDNLSGNWSEIGNEALKDISAVGYFYAREYQMCHQVHVGLIQTALGGSPIEAWCDHKIIASHRKELINELEQLQINSYIENMKQKEMEAEHIWYQNLEEANNITNGYELEEVWKKWETISIPCKYEEYEKLRDVSGIIILMKNIELDEYDLKSMNSEDLYLCFGTIVDKDDFYVNGIWIGTTDYQYPPRKYYIPKGSLKKGKNVITIKHTIEQGKGEFTIGKPYHIITKNKKKIIKLRGEWHYYVSASSEKKPMTTFYTWKATAMFYGMIYPLRHMKFKGVLWYQGESNVESNIVNADYSILLEELIALFRLTFGQENLPFVSVLLAGYGNNLFEMGPGKIACFRQEQLKALEIKEVGIVSATDLGEFNDIHPLRKKELGRRLAITMSSLINQNNIEATGTQNGPVFLKLLSHNKYWVLEFGSVSDGLIYETLPIFVVQLMDQEQWVVLKGQIVGLNKVKLMKPKTNKKVVKIAHNHIDCPNNGSLYNSKRLPCLPFVIDLKNYKE